MRIKKTTLLAGAALGKALGSSVANQRHDARQILWKGGGPLNRGFGLVSTLAYTNRAFVPSGGA